MLFETLKHSYIFLGTIYFGLLCGIFKDIVNFVLNLTKKNKIIVLIFDIIFSFIAIFLFLICINIVNYGEFRIFLLLGYVAGYLLERISLGFLVDFICKKIYTFFKVVKNKFSKTKFFKRITGRDTRKSKKVNKNC